MKRFLYIPSSAPSFANTKSLNLGSSNTNKAVELTTAFSYNNTQAITFSIWAKLGATGAYQRFFDNQDRSTYTGMMFGIHAADTVIFQIYKGSNGHTLDIRSSETVSTVGWHHYALTMDGTGTAAGCAFYRDGVALTKNISANTISGDNTSNSEKMYIGRAPDGSSFLKGRFDEAAIFTSALSAGDITTLYNAGVPNDISSTSGLVAYYRVEDNVNDSKGTVHGTALNIVAGDYSTDVP